MSSRSRSGPGLGAYRYDGDNVILYEIVHDRENVRFEFKGFANEKEHLKESDDKEKNTLLENVMALVDKGKSYRDIAQALGIPKIPTICNVV